MPEWRNWQTHTTQNRAGNHVGSSPTIGTKKNFWGRFQKVLFLLTLGENPQLCWGNQKASSFAQGNKKAHSNMI